MSTERTVYAGLLVGALFWALLSRIFLLGTTHEVGRGAAWYWGAVFVAASFASAWLFFELLEGGRIMARNQQKPGIGNLRKPQIIPALGRARRITRNTAGRLSPGPNAHRCATARRALSKIWGEGQPVAPRGAAMDKAISNGAA